MILIAKLTLCVLWLVAFLITCLIMGITFPIILLVEKLQTIADVARMN